MYKKDIGTNIPKIIINMEQNSKLTTKVGPWKMNFHSLSVRNKIIFLFLLMSLLPLWTIGTISFTSSKAAITQKTVRYSLDLLTQTVANIQLKLAGFENTSIKLFIDNGFNSTLVNFLKSRGNAVSVQKKIIDDYFSEYMINNKDIFAFMFIPETNPDYSIVITKDFEEDFWNLTKRFKETSSYQSIVKAGGGIVWSASIRLNRNHFVILGRSIKDIATGEFLGILAIVVEEDKIDQLANMTIYNQLDISFGDIENYSFIINDNGEIVSAPFKEDIGKNITGFMKDIFPLKLILEGSTLNRDYGSEVNQGSFISEVNHKKTLVTYKSIGSKIGVGGKSGWHLINIASTSSLYREISKVGLTTLILGLVFGGLAIIVSFYVATLVNHRK